MNHSAWLIVSHQELSLLLLLLLVLWFNWYQTFPVLPIFGHGAINWKAAFNPVEDLEMHPDQLLVGSALTVIDWVIWRHLYMYTNCLELTACPACLLLLGLFSRRLQNFATYLRIYTCGLLHFKQNSLLCHDKNVFILLYRNINYFLIWMSCGHFSRDYL